MDHLPSCDHPERVEQRADPGTDARAMRESAPDQRAPVDRAGIRGRCRSPPRPRTDRRRSLPPRGARPTARRSRRPLPRGEPARARSLRAAAAGARAGDALTTGAEALSPQAGYALASCRAQLLEGRGDHERAAETYLEAASGWEHHGNVPEQAYALLGRGRCLVALEDPATDEPLRHASELFGSMGYRPALAETQALIARTAAPAS